jgi:hypothetical protein
MKFWSGTQNGEPRFRWLGTFLLGLWIASARCELASVALCRTPNDGIQPQAVTDAQGVVHLIYLKGDPKAADVFYLRLEADQTNFSAPLQVNTQPGSAIAIGTIRGARLALGRNGRVHVAWNGSHSSGKHRGAPMLYTRLNDTGTAFEPERDLITYAAGLDGGGSAAADEHGNVYVMWHGVPSPSVEDETGRAVFVARSTDDGRTFARERPAITMPTGACGCCGMTAFADGVGNVFALYRAATERIHRDEILLASRNHGADFEIASTHPWKLSACPMSSASLSANQGNVLAAWETAGDVFFARVNAGTLKVTEPVSPPGNAKRKHPVAVGNGRGEVLLAWTEGTGWQTGGDVAWQLFDPRGHPTSVKGRANGVPVWSLVTTVPRADGGFMIIY